MIEQLEPCPDCGAKEPDVEVQIESSYYCVYCNNCGLSTDWHVKRRLVIEQWNTWSPFPDVPAMGAGQEDEPEPDFNTAPAWATWWDLTL